MTHEERVSAANAAVLAGRAVLRRDWYPVMHVSPFSGWAGAVCAFVRSGGLYHLFYEHNPFSATNSGAVHWGHATSDDLVQWRHHPIALAPGDDCDRDGCHAGSVVTYDDKLYAFYTGHHCMHDAADTAGEVYQVQCLAVSEDGFTFDKRGIVVKPPAHFTHFVHPHVWHEDARWWMLCAATDDKAYAHLLLYSTDDVEDWDDSVYTVLYKSEDKNVLALAHAELIAVGALRVLSFTRRVTRTNAGGESEVAGYVVGTWSPGASFAPMTRFLAHDAGGAYTAVQTCTTRDERRVAFALLSDSSSVSVAATTRSPSRSHGWHGVLTLPRVWTLDPHTYRLRTVPARELEVCRQRNHQTIEAQTLRADTRLALLTQYGDACEAKVTWAVTHSSSGSATAALSSATDARYGVWIGAACEVCVDVAARCVTLTRHYPEHVVSSRVSVALPEDAAAALTLHLFVDRSTVEVFVHDGAAALSTRIYPSSTAAERSLHLFAIGANAHILRADAWSLVPCIAQ